MSPRELQDYREILLELLSLVAVPFALGVLLALFFIGQKFFDYVLLFCYSVVYTLVVGTWEYFRETE